ncbi:DUF4238 domain-containing protein [Bacillus toyonensis]|uniref:DUF4238 domain-containing protein n=1 Tax=Bacillus toyonensis TaxID=155322 RepID=UPI001EDFA1E0|nr:DUF4238 domain-containing protein [Bacillus toyonensis]MCG3797038.1 DUF4238 domain-containing protein [Bacillus toyonensis]
MSNRNQHVVPQGLLKYFTKDAKVYFYNYGEHLPIKSSPRGIDKLAHRPYFYDFTWEALKSFGIQPEELGMSEEDRIQWVETVFFARDVENDLAHIIRQLNSVEFHEGPIEVTEEEKEILSEHIVTQHLRGPVMRKMIEAASQALNKVAIEMDIDKLKHDTPEYSGLLHFYCLLVSKKIRDQLKEFLYNSDWIWTINKSDMPFFISDNPVIFFETEFGMGTCLPLGSELALNIIAKSQNHPQALCRIVTNENIEDIKSLNLEQVRQCDRQVFCEENCFDWLIEKDITRKSLSLLVNHENFEDEMRIKVLSVLTRMGLL